MPTRFLPSVYLNSNSEIEEVEKNFGESPGFEKYERLWNAYRVQAACRLFLTGAVELFQNALMDSSHVLRYMLSNLELSQVVLSRSSPLFDAIVSGNNAALSELKTAIANIPFHSDLEYEEDYHYYKFVIYLGNGSEPQSLQSIVDKMKEIAGEDTPRINICQAFVEGSSNDFSDNLIVLSEGHNEYYRALLTKGVLKEEEWVVNGHICIESIALLLLGAKYNIRCKEKDIVGVPLDINKLVF